MNHKVSIVVIGRNEESAVGRCLEAAREAAAQIGGAEMIFADSASTDHTAAVAESHGFRVLSLKPEWKLCPSAGRFVGSRYARGDFILFIDADTLVYRDFLPSALEYFEKNPQVGGVNGRLDDLNENGELLTGVEERYESAADVKWLRGPCCFYRRRALEEAGTFNPHLAVEEEAELGLRLIKKGWKLRVIPLSMACHTRCYHGRSLDSIVSTFRRDIMTGRLGEVTRATAYAFEKGNCLAFCWLRLKTTILFLAWLLLLAAILLFVPEYLYPKTIAAAAAISGTLAVYTKKRSLKQTLLFMLNKTLCLVDIAAGVHKIKVENPNSYPLDIVERSPRPTNSPRRKMNEACA